MTDSHSLTHILTSTTCTYLSYPVRRRITITHIASEVVDTKGLTFFHLALPHTHIQHSRTNAMQSNHSFPPPRSIDGSDTHPLDKKHKYAFVLYSGEAHSTEAQRANHLQQLRWFCKAWAWRERGRSSRHEGLFTTAMSDLEKDKKGSWGGWDFYFFAVAAITFSFVFHGNDDSVELDNFLSTFQVSRNTFFK